MRDPKKRAISNACSYMNRCYDLGVTAEELVAMSKTRHKTACHKTACRKEKGKGKEKFPPAPPIEKRESQEKAAVKNMFADANLMVGDVDLVPTFDMFLAWCEKAGFKDIERCKAKFDETKLCGWKDNQGKCIRNWPKFFLKALRGNPFKGAYHKLSGDMRMMFDGFWKAYPNRRRTEKDKCAHKFRSLLDDSPSSVAMFNTIMEGLEKWKASGDWRKDDGEYVMMPYRWLLNSYWTVTPAEVRIAARRGVSQTANVHSKEVGRW